MTFLSTRWRIGCDLLLAVGALTVLLLTIYVNNSLVVRRLMSLPAMLFSPGYLLLAVLYPHQKQLDKLERLVGSVATSVAIVVLLGLALNQTPLGIDTRTFTGALLADSLFMAAVAYCRRRRSLEQEDQTPSGVSESLSVFRCGGRTFVTVAAAGLAIPLVTFYYIALFPPQQKAAPTTQFYLESVSGNLEDLTSRVDVNQSITVILGVVNLEKRYIQYEIYRHIDGEQDLKIATVDLNAGQEWEMSYMFYPPELASARQVVFFLTKKDDAVIPYRTLYLWLER